MTYEEMEKALANATVASFAAPAKSNEALLIKALNEVTHVIDKLEKQIAELQARISELERKGYVGVWKDGKEYTAQSEVTHEGARWIAHKRTSDKPGASADWSLMEKSAVNPRSDTGTVNARSRALQPTEATMSFLLRRTIELADAWLEAELERSELLLIDRGATGEELERALSYQRKNLERDRAAQIAEVQAWLALH